MAWHRIALPWAPILLALSLWSFPTVADPTVPIIYCASINTANTAANASNFQSDGLCHDWCFLHLSPPYHLAIVQWQTCWCSNYVPDSNDQVSASKCDLSCPGYPQDWCGQTSATSLWGYMTNAAVQASGTATAATVTTSETSTQTSTTFSTFSLNATTETSQSTGQSSVTSSSGDASSTSSASSTAGIVSTITVGGTVTVVTTTPTSTGASSGIDVSSSNNGISGGAIAGIVVGVIVAIVAVVAIFLLLRYRRRNAENEDGAFEGGSKRASSSGMMGTPQTGQTSADRYANGGDGRQMAETWENNPNALGRRRSAIMPVDPRLDYAKGIYVRNDNRSRESIGSLQDNQDYSRPVHEPKKVLRVTNPEDGPA